MENNTTQTESSDKQWYKFTFKKLKKINPKTAVIIAVIIVAAALAYTYKGLFIAATVDGIPIGRLDVIKRLESSSGKSVLDSLIVETLVQREASKNNIAVSSDEVNAEIKKIEDQVKASGATLEEALSAQGMTMEDLKEQIILQKELEKLVADKIQVTDEEVAQYIKDNKISLPAGEEATTTAQIKEGMRSQKLSIEANALITALKSQAKIRYFVNY